MGSIKRDTEEMKLWLFDLAHGNLNSEEIVKGFVKHYVLYGYARPNVQDDIIFHTTYGTTGAKTALDNLNMALMNFAQS